MTPNLHLWIIPLLPLAGAAINGVMGKRFSRRGVAAAALIFCGAAFFSSLWIASQFSSLSLPYVDPHPPTWLRSGHFSVGDSFSLHHLPLARLLVVTDAAFLIPFYSASYTWAAGGYYY